MLLPVLLQLLPNQVTQAPPLHISNLLDILIETWQHRQADPFLRFPVLLGPALLSADRCRRTIDYAANH